MKKLLLLPALLLALSACAPDALSSKPEDIKRQVIQRDACVNAGGVYTVYFSLIDSRGEASCDLSSVKKTK